MAKSLFVIIFEGRTGSSELIARLNSHPLIQAYPEILATICSSDADPVRKWDLIRDIFSRLRDGLEIDSWLAEYSKVGGSSERLPVRGIKTRLNEMSDLSWYQKAGRPQNFYAVEPSQFIPLIEEFNVKLIRLRRANVVKHAVSWLRAAHLSNNTRDGLWNIRRGEPGLGAINVDVDFLIHTIQWLIEVQKRHDEAYLAFNGQKMMVNYEDVLLGGSEWLDRILGFLEVCPIPLPEFHQKLTDDRLMSSIINYDEVAGRLEAIGLGDYLRCGE